MVNYKEKFLTAKRPLDMRMDSNLFKKNLRSAEGFYTKTREKKFRAALKIFLQTSPPCGFEEGYIIVAG